MKWLMRKCVKCGRYTLKESCPECGGATSIPHPAKFSPDDKYAKYRAVRTGPTDHGPDIKESQSV